MNRPGAMEQPGTKPQGPKVLTWLPIIRSKQNHNRIVLE